MVRHSEERIHERKKMFGGEGEAEFHRILNGPEEMYGKGRVFSHTILEKGAEIGWHVHHGDSETYLILKGQGLYNGNGILRNVGPGDVTIVGDGEGHALQCISDEPLEAIALILYT
jgi:mannose-6-phosphate isomerase-like protein (cupin superfamily)